MKCNDNATAMRSPVVGSKTLLDTDSEQWLVRELNGIIQYVQFRPLVS